MKTRFLRSWKLVIILAGLPLAKGNFSGPGSAAAAQEAAPVDSPLVAPPVPDNPPAALQPAVPAPPAIRLSPGATEIAKLARAGLGEDVMLAYVSNINSTFNLGSDQIVYLNDLGVSGTVVKAMIQSDAQYNAAAQAWAAGNQPPPVPPSSPPPVPADNGSYSNPSDDNPAVTVDPGDMTDYTNPGDYGTADDTDYFYNSLMPYGSWVYVSGAGLCWQPTVCRANRAWQPYLDRGRWVYTDCGWYWQSDYSWGWAAFHYGRWFNDRGRGWVWRPDHVWGPAWVSWRQSAEICGWAPLPPSARFAPGTGFQYRGHAVPANFDFGLRASQYTFIPVARMTDYSPYRYAASSSESGALFSQTAAINHVAFEHNRVVSRGIDPRQVAMASGIEVRQAEVHESAVNPNGGVMSDHMSKQGNSLMIFRPQLSAPGTASPRQFSAPPSRNPGASKSSMNGAAVGAAASQAQAHVETYPPGSLVLSGRTSGSGSQASGGNLPNLNFSHRVSSQPVNSSYYAAASPMAAYEAQQNYNRLSQMTRSAPPVAPTFNGYRQEFASGQSSVVIPPRFNVASRMENHSAYAVYGGNQTEPAAEPRQTEWAGYASQNHHAASGEPSTGSHSEHIEEHSAPVSHSSSYSSSSSSSHSSSSSASSPASSGHH